MLLARILLLLADAYALMRYEHCAQSSKLHASARALKLEVVVRDFVAVNITHRFACTYMTLFFAVT